LRLSTFIKEFYDDESDLLYRSKSAEKVGVNRHFQVNWSMLTFFQNNIIM